MVPKDTVAREGSELTLSVALNRDFHNGLELQLDQLSQDVSTHPGRNPPIFRLGCVDFGLKLLHGSKSGRKYNLTDYQQESSVLRKEVKSQIRNKKEGELRRG